MKLKTELESLREHRGWSRHMGQRYEYGEPVPVVLWRLTRFVPVDSRNSVSRTVEVQRRVGVDSQAKTVKRLWQARRTIKAEAEALIWIALAALAAYSIFKKVSLS